jgi:polysaccharide biosynthesis/export protein
MKYPLLLLFLLAAAMGFAQAAVSPAPPAPPPAVNDRVALALSAESYPVTPGDVYALTYWQGGASVTATLLVQGDETIDMGIFGTIGTGGMTFLSLKQAVKTTVANLYPRGLPSLVLSSVGAFRILVKGELPETRYVPAWGLTRLSEIVAATAGPTSSLRDVRVISRGGSEKRYDLFKARRLGMMEQDPYARPGETIVLSRAAVTVQVLGEVQQPGRYQVLPGEDLPALVNIFAGGLTADADVARASLDSFTENGVKTSPAGLRETDPDPPLKDGDVVRIPSKTASLPVIYFEGAVMPPAGSLQSPAPSAGTASPAGGTSAYGRISATYLQGEKLSEALVGVRTSIAPLADLRHASVIHADNPAPVFVDLQKILADPNAEEDMPLRPFDRVVIPVSRYFVFISGSVTTPGSYPYAPNQTFRYYMGLAGAPPSNGENDKVSVLDAQGNGRRLTDYIQPEDSIYIAPSLVTVWGAVISPGNYAWRPGRDATYYIGLAGGVDSAKNSDGAFEITDILGKKRAPKEAPMSGDRIHVVENSFLYGFNQYFPVFASTVTLIAAVASITSVVIGLLPK